MLKYLIYSKITIYLGVLFLNKTQHTFKTNAVVTPLRKATSYEPRIAILGIWSDTWLTRGNYGIYVAVRGSYGVYVTPSAT